MKDADYMRLAIRLAQRGIEGVSPNPLVGAILVKDGEIVGRGWHRFFGKPHAEVEAIRNAGAKAAGTDLYVTLEPCNHSGKTPPCTQAILQAGIRKVVYAAGDPNPLARGKGPRLLESRGIHVRGGLLAAEAEKQNAPYFYWRRSGLPWVLLKWAMTWDGKIATVSGESRWISGERSRSMVQKLRRRVDAILVGTGTALADDPVLLPRPPRGRLPLRIILDRRGRLPLNLKLFSPGPGSRLYVTGTAAASGTSGRRRLRRIEALGIDLLVLKERRGKLSLTDLLTHLGRRDVSQLLVEGGGELHGDFIDQRLAREVAVFIAPRLLGGARAPGPIGGDGIERLSEALRLEPVKARNAGTDLFLSARLKY